MKTQTSSWLEVLTASDWTLILGLLTLGIVCFQVYLMVKQLRIMDKQLDIMERQDEMLDRRADLLLEIESRYNNPQRTDRTFDFNVNNKGNKGAKDFYWHLMIPHSVAQFRRLSKGRHECVPEDATRNVDGIQYTVYRGFYAEPVYPKRPTHLCTLRVDGTNVAQPVAIYWGISAEDGVFPETGGMTRVEIPA